MTNIDMHMEGNIKVATDDFRGLPLDIRKCYFFDEGNLKIFKMYTQSNCELECLWREAFR